MAIFWVIAAHSVDHMLSLYFDYFNVFVMLVISRFGFGGWVWDLIASFHGLCVLFNPLTFFISYFPAMLAHFNFKQLYYCC